MVGLRVRVRVQVRVSGESIGPTCRLRAGLHLHGNTYCAHGGGTAWLVVVLLTMAHRTYYGAAYLLWRTVLTMAHRTYFGAPYLLWRTVLAMAHRTYYGAPYGSP